MRLAIATLILCALAGAARAEQTLKVEALPNDNGKHLKVSWTETPAVGAITIVVRKREQANMALGQWTAPEKPAAGADVGEGWTIAYAGDSDTSFTDEVEPETAYIYEVVTATKAVGPDGKPTWELSPGVASDRGVAPEAALFNTDNWFYLAVIGFTGIAFFLYLGYARRNAKNIFIRRIPGVDAIEDAIGRSTEMGRPVLYVTGIEEIVDIQTIASLLILGPVAELTAEYDTEIKVANTYPMTMIVAEEIVRQGYANAGRLDAHKPENVMFLTSEQFAFAAAVNGMILRDRPAVNIYFGRFFAESLLLAETGFLTGAVQIAGTCEFTQLPFFIAACDYTLLGEELYAVGAYLSREPTLLTQLKVGDMLKLIIMILIVVGVVAATVDGFKLADVLMPGGE